MGAVVQCKCKRGDPESEPEPEPELIPWVGAMTFTGRRSALLSASVRGAHAAGPVSKFFRVQISLPSAENKCTVRLCTTLMSDRACDVLLLGGG